MIQDNFCESAASGASKGGPAPAVYDVAIIGGALSGAAAATVLLKENPALRVLIIERSDAFERRVGESTIEISSFFLLRVLGLADHLNEHHYVKQGLRFWFSNDQSQKLDECSEIGGKFLSRVPAFMVDRAVLDEEVLRRACALGAELWRPAKLTKIELVHGGEQKLTVRDADGAKREVRARWAVDASGVQAVLARQEGWHRPNEEHPTTSVWSRWSGVKNWDGPELARKFPEWAASCYGMRNTATNHLMGDGWWSWWIPLKGGDVSVGIVFDQRLVTLPPGPNMGERLRSFLVERSPIAREMLAAAHWQEGDVHYRKNLPYSSTTYAGDGFALVGDAAGFIDPFYSPGLDWISYTASAAADLILAERRGEADLAARIERQNNDFVRSYRRWFESIYKDKYEYMGDFDLMRIAFLFDLGLYYIFVASQPFRSGAKALVRPIYALPPSTPFFYFMRFYNRRCAQMARVRRARGTYGVSNAGRRFLFPGFTFSITSGRPLLKALASWAWLELTEGWRSWGGRCPKPVASKQPDAPETESPLPTDAPAAPAA
jgi:flavin-dependent dehydrogenase